MGQTYFFQVLGSTAPEYVSQLQHMLPSVDGCVDTGAKILAEASIFHPFDAQLLSTPGLDFLVEAIKILDSGEVMASIGLWLVVHGGKK